MHFNLDCGSFPSNDDKTLNEGNVMSKLNKILLINLIFVGTSWASDGFSPAEENLAKRIEEELRTMPQEEYDAYIEQLRREAASARQAIQLSAVMNTLQLGTNPPDDNTKPQR